jgi:hypothetical protein
MRRQGSTSDDEAKAPCISERFTAMTGESRRARFDGSSLVSASRSVCLLQFPSSQRPESSAESDARGATHRPKHTHPRRADVAAATRRPRAPPVGERPFANLPVQPTSTSERTVLPSARLSRKPREHRSRRPRTPREPRSALGV